MSASRKKIPPPIQAEVLAQCRRRCCICFGLYRDDGVKKGQIAHLDGNRNNNRIENLAFLCFDHHDEYDSTTSQSKGLSKAEIGIYREELAYHFGSWSTQLKRDELLNFLAFQIDLDAMAKAAVKAAKSVVWNGEELAFKVLITDNIDYCDSDLYTPHLVVLDHFASWGWLTYTEEEKEVDGDIRVFIKTERKNICDDVASQIQKRRHDRGEKNEGFFNPANNQKLKSSD